MTDQLSNRSHRRRNALTGDWVTVSPQRTERPWQGEMNPFADGVGMKFEPDCYLCPGNTRVSGEINPTYTSAWAFDNDFPAFQAADRGVTASTEELPQAESLEADLFQSAPASGRCRVLCYHPDHQKTLARMTEEELLAVVRLWSSEVRVLRRAHQWVQVFENRGAMMGCSNAHPHGQIWAVDHLPNEAAKELRQQQAWFESHQSVLLEVYRLKEEQLGERVVASNEFWTVVVPYWAVWPFETLLLPRRAVDHLDALEPSEQRALADILRRVLSAYDTLFSTSCPYTMGWHGAPGKERSLSWQLHAHLYPPLLRSASVRKHMVGYEMLSEAQRDLSPEHAADRIRRAMIEAN